MAEQLRHEWAVVGGGGIGRELMSQVLSDEEVARRLGLAALPEWTARSTGLYVPDDQALATENSREALLDPTNYRPVGIESWQELDAPPEVVFIALPSGDAVGDEAIKVIEWAGKAGSMVITAEKRSQAFHFDRISLVTDSQERFGKSASLGGGTHMVEVAEIFMRDLDNVTQIHMAPNGTMTSVMGELRSPDISLGLAISNAQDRGYAEPEAQSAAEVFRGESESDVAMKVHNFMRSTGMAEHFDWQELKISLSEEDIIRIQENSENMRLIASIYPADGPLRPESGIIPDLEDGGVIVSGTGGRDWRIVIGYRDVSKNTLLRPLGDMSGPGNGIIIGLGPDESDGIYRLVGPGAGAGPTVNAMLDDLVKLERRKMAEQAEFDRAFAQIIGDLAVGGYSEAISYLNVKYGKVVERVD